MDADDLEHPPNAFAEFDRYADDHPELTTPEAFAQWLAGRTGGTVIGRQVDGPGFVVAIPEDAPRG